MAWARELRRGVIKTGNVADLVAFDPARVAAGPLETVRVLEPLGYVEMLAVLDGASVVLTDSGGVQEETTVLGVPCITLRAQTERPVTVIEGTNRLAPWPLTAAGIFESWAHANAEGRIPVGTRAPAGWDGRAAARIVRAIEDATIAAESSELVTTGAPDA